MTEDNNDKDNNLKPLEDIIRYLQQDIARIKEMFGQTVKRKTDIELDYQRLKAECGNWKHKHYQVKDVLNYIEAIDQELVKRAYMNHNKVKR